MISLSLDAFLAEVTGFAISRKPTLYNNVGLMSKGSEDIVSESIENRRFRHYNARN